MPLTTDSLKGGRKEPATPSSPAKRPVKTRAKNKKQGEIFVAAESFVGVLASGNDFLGTKNVTRVRAGHEALKLWPQLFKPMDVHYDIEQATAAPGEQRGE